MPFILNQITFKVGNILEKAVNDFSNVALNINHLIPDSNHLLVHTSAGTMALVKNQTLISHFILLGLFNDTPLISSSSPSSWSCFWWPSLAMGSWSSSSMLTPVYTTPCTSSSAGCHSWTSCSSPPLYHGWPSTISWAMVPSPSQAVGSRSCSLSPSWGMSASCWLLWPVIAMWPSATHWGTQWSWTAESAGSWWHCVGSLVWWMG